MSMKIAKDLGNKINESHHHCELDALAREVRDLYRVGLISADEFEGLVAAGKLRREHADSVAEDYEFNYVWAAEQAYERHLEDRGEPDNDLHLLPSFKDGHH